LKPDGGAVKLQKITRGARDCFGFHQRQDAGGTPGRHRCGHIAMAVPASREAVPRQCATDSVRSHSADVDM